MSAKWEEIYSQDDIKKIQTIELESLRVFSQVCEKLGIEFFLYGGSLLGAIKYQGFVPWDDDLDLALMRKDYELLLKEGSRLLPPEYEMQHPNSNAVTPFPYIKFRRTDTAMVEYYLHKLKMNHGIYFDIYPIDNIPDDDEKYHRVHNKVQNLLRWFNLRQVRPLLSRDRKPKECIKYWIKLVRYAMLHAIPHDYLIRKMEKEMTAFNSVQTKRQGNYFYPKPVNYFDGIFPLKEVIFENRSVKIPAGYEVNLKNRYGDISQMPPEEERVGHIPYILSFGGNEHVH